MIKKGQVLNGTIAGTSSSGVHSVNLGGTYNLLKVPSCHPKDQYFDGQNVAIGFINPDAPIILSRGFRAPRMILAVYPPVPPSPPFPEGNIHFRLVESIKIVEIIVYDYNIFPYPHSFYAEWYYWFEYLYKDQYYDGQDVVEVWERVSPVLLSGWHGKSATPDQWRRKIYDLWYSIGYSYFTSNWEDLSEAYYPHYNTEYEIQNYLQNQIESLIDSGETDPDNLMNYYKNLSKSCYVDQWNAAFPGTFTDYMK